MKTGSIPGSLATLPNLGVLHIGSNHLSGDLSAFAAALVRPEAAAASANSSTPLTPSRLFDLNVSSSGLTGSLPPALASLGFFNGAMTVLVPGTDGGAAVAARVLDVSGNKMHDSWPTWLLEEVPVAASTCGCAMTVKLAGPDMRLTCPPPNFPLSDYAWQLASRLRYQCWDAAANRDTWLLDFLVSPANGADKIDTTSTARGDGSGAPAWQVQQRARTTAIAGGVVGGLVGMALLGGLVWMLVGRRALATHKATSFTKFADDASVLSAEIGSAAATEGAPAAARDTTSSAAAAM